MEACLTLLDLTQLLQKLSATLLLACFEEYDIAMNIIKIYPSHFIGTVMSVIET